MDKKELRKSIQRQLVKLPKEDRDALSAEIRENLFATDAWKNAGTIGVTVSRGTEIDTYPIIRQGWEEGKVIVVPKCHPKDYSMTFHKLTSFDELETVYYGLKEPIADRTETVTPDEIDLLLVPGLLFDKDGYRVGFGGGYYDRFLERYTNRTLSLLYPDQFVEKLPRESFDRPVDILVFPDKVMNVNK